ncbi:hypothetical protein AB0D74_48470 [Streptomyces sp. NPDC048278]|uniref:hypothetical protein n=1 Tax=Streptomyces sp. NPDC048278 TaxID=3155809 RepID=UPI00343D34ED
MSVEILLIGCVLVLLVLFVVAGVAETRREREQRTAARIVQPPRRQAAPEVTHWEPEWSLMRARRVRRTRGHARFCLDNPAVRARWFAEYCRRTTH